MTAQQCEYCNGYKTSKTSNFKRHVARCSMKAKKEPVSFAFPTVRRLLEAPYSVRNTNSQEHNVVVRQEERDEESEECSGELYASVDNFGTDSMRQAPTHHRHTSCVQANGSPLPHASTTTALPTPPYIPTLHMNQQQSMFDITLNEVSQLKFQLAASEEQVRRLESELNEIKFVVNHFLAQQSQIAAILTTHNRVR